MIVKRKYGLGLLVTIKTCENETARKVVDWFLPVAARIADSTFDNKSATLQISIVSWSWSYKK